MAITAFNGQCVDSGATYTPANPAIVSCFALSANSVSNVEVNGTAIAVLPGTGTGQPRTTVHPIYLNAGDILSCVTGSFGYSSREYS